MEEQKKGGNKVLVIVIIIVVALVALVIGGYFVSQYLARKTAENMVNSLTGGKVNVDTGNDSFKLSDGNTTISGNQNMTWPTDLPSGAPKYSGGKIVSVSSTKSPQTWMITIDKTSKTEFEAYKTAVQAAGWEGTDENQILVEMFQAAKEGWVLSATFDPSSNGVLITISKKA